MLTQFAQRRVGAKVATVAAQRFTTSTTRLTPTPSTTPRHNVFCRTQYFTQQPAQPVAWTTGGVSLAAAAGVVATGDGEKPVKMPQDLISEDKRMSNRTVVQDDVFKPKGKPANPIPALAWIIRKDMQDPKKFEILKEAVSSTLHARSAPDYNDSEPQESVRNLQSKIIHDMHRVSICLAPIAQNLSMVNNFGQQFNREKKRAIVPIFTLDNLSNFQRRLVNRYQRVMEFDHTNMTDEEAKDAWDKLKGAEQLCQYDVALMYCVDQSVEMFHPRHPKSFLQQSIRAQADYMIRRRGLIAKKIKEETPDIGEEEFKAEFNKRVALDTQLLNEMLEQRRIDEQKRWAQMQRAQVMRARAQRQEALDKEKAEVFEDDKKKK